MRARRLRLSAVAVLFAMSGVAVADGDGYRWKDGHSFEIYRVSGVERTCEAGARITLEVFGRSISGNVDPDPKSGFNVQAYIDHVDLPEATTGANGKWKKDLHGWVVELSAPQEFHEDYRLQVSLYCATEPSPCSETYGRAAQVTETYHFDVR